MKINGDLENISAIFKNRKVVKPPAYEWQDLALRVIKEISAPPFKRSSVFKLCKENPKIIIEQALNDTKELCRDGQAWKYFFKVIDNRLAGKTGVAKPRDFNAPKNKINLEPEVEA